MVKPRSSDTVGRNHMDNKNFTFRGHSFETFSAYVIQRYYPDSTILCITKILLPGETENITMVFPESQYWSYAELHQFQKEFFETQLKAQGWLSPSDQVPFCSESARKQGLEFRKDREYLVYYYEDDSRHGHVDIHAGMRVMPGRLMSSNTVKKIPPLKPSS